MVALPRPERIRRLEPVAAPTEEQPQIAELSDVLHAPAASAASDHYELVDPKGQRHTVPRAVVDVLARIAEVMARGDALTVVPVGTVMTTQQAADLLNVSRQYLVRLLDGGQLPYARTGKHRRLKVEDVVAFKEKRDRERDVNLDELARMTEELGGYDE